MDKTVLEEQLVDMLAKGLAAPRISVVGCGGAGNNVVHSIYWNAQTDVETIAVNTDEEKLKRIDAHKKVLIGRDFTNGMGAEGSPELGEHCADCARDTFGKIFDESDIVFVVAGMGGGTGTGAAPVIAQVAKERGAVTFAIAINPFSHEVCRCDLAKEGIAKLREVTETTIVLDNDRLLEIAGDLAIRETFSIMEKSIMKIIDSVNTRISESFFTQIESDVREMLKEYDDQDLPARSEGSPKVGERSVEPMREIGAIGFGPNINPGL